MNTFLGHDETDQGIEFVSRTNLDLSKKGQEKEQKAQAKAAKEKEDKKALVDANKKLAKEVEQLKKQAAAVNKNTVAEPKKTQPRRKKQASNDFLETPSEVTLNDVASTEPLIQLLCAVEECDCVANDVVTAGCKYLFCDMHGPNCENHIFHKLRDRTNPCVYAKETEESAVPIETSNVILPDGDDPVVITMDYGNSIVSDSEVIKKRRSKSIGEKMVNFAEDREVKEDHVRGNQKVVCTITSEPSGKRNKVCHLSSGNFAISIYYCL